MPGDADGRAVRDLHGLTDTEFRSLVKEMLAEARRCFFGRPPRVESELALRTQHAEFGAAAH
ncbi:hypothetical protein ACFYUJ_13230 [Streptomyces sp. NPDC004520]|uniref:hypothetical protein n=1 Tax=Streptomyces sp. NPDC004520 TaxID=3364702 RepID=UPI0036ACB211